MLYKLLPSRFAPPDGADADTVQDGVDVEYNALVILEETVALFGITLDLYSLDCADRLRELRTARRSTALQVHANHALALLPALDAAADADTDPAAEGTPEGSPVPA